MKKLKIMKNVKFFIIINNLQLIIYYIMIVL